MNTRKSVGTRRRHRRSWARARNTSLTAAIGAIVLCTLSACSPGSPTKSPASAMSSTSTAETFTDAEQMSALRPAMTSVVRSGVVPGIVVLVRHGGAQVVLTEGLADTRAGRRMSAGDRFRVASLTKPMVATVVMQLVQSGQLGLEGSIDTWLPGLLPNSTITIRQLLAHTSGLADYENQPAAKRVFSHPPVDPRALVEVAARAAPLFAPGEGQEYSNTNYQVLGLLIEKVTGRSLESNLDQRIIKPLRMTSASMSPSRWTEQPLAHGYLDGRDVSQTDLSPGWAAGGVVSNAIDISRFFRALFADRLVPKNAVNDMTKPAADDLGTFSGYGLGIGELSTRCGAALGHFGAWDGYASAAFTHRVTDREAVLLVNASRDATTGPLRDILETALCGP